MFQLYLWEYLLSGFFLHFVVFSFLNWYFCLLYVELYQPKLIHEVSYFHFSFWVYKECRLRHHFLSNSFGREDKEESDVIASIQSDMMCGRHESNVLILLYHLEQILLGKYCTLVFRKDSENATKADHEFEKAFSIQFESASNYFSRELSKYDDSNYIDCESRIELQSKWVKKIDWSSR